MIDSHPFVSVLIPMFNEENYIERSLVSAVSQDYPPSRYEIIVIDGHSEDASVELVCEMSKHYDNIQLLRNPRRITSVSLNMGIEQSSGDIVVLLSAHSIAPSDYLSNCVRCLLEAGVDHVSGIMECVGTTYWGRSIGLATGCRFGVGDSKLHDTQREGLAERGFCGAYWKETLVNIGLFDETFTIGEDYELYLRLVKSGGRILLTPRIKMMYFCRDTLMRLFEQYFRYGFWKAKVFKKHKGMTSFRALVPALFIVYSSLMLLLSLLAEAFFYAFIVAVIPYLLVNILFSIKISSKQGPGYLCSLPLAFLTLHISHGLGFIAGVLDSFLLSRNRGPKT